MVLQELAWVKQARMEYVPNLRDRSKQTDFARGLLGNNLLQNKVFSEMDDASTLDLLLVGAGIDNLEIYYCPVEPYVMAAFLESFHKDYRLDIVDSDQRVISDISNRQRVYLPDCDSVKDYQRSGWDNYLKLTRQTARLVTCEEIKSGTSPTDLELTFLASRNPPNFFCVNVPPQFLKRLRDGTIKLITGDIASVSLPADRQYDFVACFNIFYLLSEQGQKLALYNLVNKMKSGGFIGLNDGLRDGNPLLKECGGWLDESKREELGLRLDVLYEKGRYREATLIKNR